jgi:Alpha-kinase family
VEECSRLLAQRRRGALVQQPVPSFAVAVKNAFFSEGVERLVRKVRFLDEQGNFFGPKMVAKQSRFVEEEGTSEARMDYHRQFLRTQAFASEMAQKFNAALDELASKPPQQQVELQKLPRVRFLVPLVFELVNGKCEEINQLVEEMLEGPYEKFNNNMGFVQRVQTCPLMEHCWEGGDSFPVSHAEPTQSLSSRVEDLFQTLTMKHRNGTQALLPVVEDGDEYGETASSDPSNAELVDRRQEGKAEGDSGSGSLRISPHDVIQAFSHFSFERSKKNLMVVDLQGILQTSNDDGRQEFVLTDPAIHSNRKAVRLSNLNLGRTDRGDKGISSFFKSHVCGEACRLLDLPNSSHY